MKRENDEITDLFRSRLGHAEMQVRENFWEELSSSMAVCRRHRRVVFFRIAAAASVLLVLGVSSAAFWYFSPKEEIGEAFTQIAVRGSAGNLDGDVVKQEFAPIHAKPVLQKPVHKNYGLYAQQPDEENDSLSVTVSMSFTFSAVSSTTTRRKTNSQRGENLWQTDNDSEASPAKRQSNGLTGSSDGFESPRSWALKASIGTALPAGARKYKMPFSAGITIEKKFNEILSVETGLLYTRLSAGQKLHYLGIPLKLNVTFAETPKVNFYASVGGVADKCIAGAPDNSFKKEPVQLALTGGIGVNYKINDRMALFVEPGVSHHFKTDSRLETVRTARPTNFNLICGLRMAY